MKIRGNAVSTTMKRSDFFQEDEKKSDYIKNNPFTKITDADEGKHLLVKDKKVVYEDVPYVPMMSALDDKEDVVNNWFTKPQDIYPRVYTDSAASKAPYNKFFLTGPANAPKDPNGQSFSPGTGLYYNYFDPPPSVTINAIDRHTGLAHSAIVVSDKNVEHNSKTFKAISAEEYMGDTTSPIIRIASTEQYFSKGRKAVFECGFCVAKAPTITLDDKWFAKLTFRVNETNAWAKSGSGQFLLWCSEFDEDGDKMISLNVVGDNRHYKLGKVGEWCNLKFAQLDNRVGLFVNDVHLAEFTVPVNISDSTYTILNGFDFDTRGAASLYELQFTDVFCGVVDEDVLYSGRYLDSVAGRRRNRHILVPSKLSDYKDYLPDGLSADEYALSYGAAKDMLEEKADLVNGRVPASQLPSYVDDVLEYSGMLAFPTTGETGKIYVDRATNKLYRWSGSFYVEISSSLALGETSETAYRGDRGKIAYDHSQKTSGNPHKVTAEDVGAAPIGHTHNSLDLIAEKIVGTVETWGYTTDYFRAGRLYCISAAIDGQVSTMIVFISAQLGIANYNSAPDTNGNYARVYFTNDDTTLLEFRNSNGAVAAANVYIREI